MGKIDGRALADKTFEGLKEKAAALRHSGFTPSLRVVMVGEDPASASIHTNFSRGRSGGLVFPSL